LTNVLAVVVTYHPGPDLSRNLKALREQVDTVVVIDNGSTDIELIRRTALDAACQLVSNKSNVGIAAALNQAVVRAQDGGFAWLATFDQDSLPKAGAIAELIELYEKHPQRERIALVAMSHKDTGTGRDYHLPGDIIEETQAWRSVRATITSGSLIPTRIFREVGIFDERLFIDSVDHEFCLHCRSNGFLIIEGREQVMDHSIGSAVSKRILGLDVAFTNHSSLRRYYMVRNQLEVYFRYIFVDPYWSLRGFFYLVVSNTLVLTHEDQKGKKFKAMAMGLRDFVFRRFGARLM
jgi:rhamnosyltransferase